MKETIAALTKVQHELGVVSKNKVNAHLRSKYADLGAYLDELDPLLGKYGLALVQAPSITEGHAGVDTKLYGPDGIMEFGALMLPLQKMDAHAVGSAITYARRYAIAGIFKMRADDDDGHTAVHGKASKKEVASAPLVGALESSIDWAGELKAIKARMLGAENQGELKEAFSAAQDALKSGMPKEWFVGLVELKDKRKGEL